MKDLIKIPSFLLIFVFCETGFAAELVISNLRSNQGHIAVNVFSEASKDHFPDDSSKAVKTYYIPAPDSADLKLSLEGIEPGRYAIAVMHDEDSNKKLKTTLFGIPREGFGFSKNPAIYFGPPKFEKAAVQISKSAQIEIKMKHFL